MALLLLISGCGDAPLGLEVRIAPSLPTAAEDLRAEIATPPAVDGDVTYAYRWFLDGVAIPGQNEAVLPAAETSADQSWRVVVIPTLSGVSGEVGTASVVIRPVNTAVDADGDGVAAPPDGEDCDDADPEVYLGAEELCDSKDNDCDGAVDEDFDQDGDGVTTCAPEPDCDDESPEISPLAAEECDGKDNNCDGAIDEGFDDLDGDGSATCFDCDDGDALNFPGNVELCDGRDNTCDGAVDEGFEDTDGDTFTCDDCAEGVAAAYPGAPPLCDGVPDNDCDGLTDPDEVDGDGDGASACDGDCDDADATYNLADDDGDGVTTCALPPDCDDSVASNFPGNPEQCDGLDNDCDGNPESSSDADGDGITVCAGDCDDGNANVAPTLPEVCDGLDNDCNGAADEGYADDDGDGSAACVDCDDLAATVFPGAPELCDALDNDCDGLADEGLDGDGDGVTTCGPDGVAGTADDDCNDSAATVYPGAPDVCDPVIDNDCDGVPDPLQADTDGDGDSVCAGDCDDGNASLNINDVDGDGVDTCSGDCDDTDANNAPQGFESCDGADNNCDNVIDDGYDLDNDGAFTGSDPACVATYGGAAVDCDDTDPDVAPGASDVCDGIADNDCDGLSDCDGDCDDADATVNPSVPEDPTNGVDDDCDGAVDELPPPRHLLDFSSAPYVTVHTWDFGTGDFGAAVQYAPPTSQDVNGGVVADFNSDGLEDMLLQTGSSFGQDQVWHYAGTASGTFTLVGNVFGFSGLGADLWTTGDVDNDGDADVIGWDSGGEGFVWLTSPGTSSWTQVTVGGAPPFELDYWSPSSSSQFHESVHLPLVDVDLDGNLDIVECGNNSASPTQCIVHSGAGDGTFSSSTTFTLNRIVNGFAIADYDGDGALDLIGGFDDDGDAGQSWIWTGGLTNWSGGGLTAVDLNPASGTAASNAPGYGWPYAMDADQDGDPDLIVKIIEPFSSGNRILYFVENQGGGALTFWTLGSSWTQHGSNQSLVQDALGTSP